MSMNLNSTANEIIDWQMNHNTNQPTRLNYFPTKPKFQMNFFFDIFLLIPKQNLFSKWNSSL